MVNIADISKVAAMISSTMPISKKYKPLSDADDGSYITIMLSRIYKFAYLYRSKIEVIPATTHIHINLLLLKLSW